MSHPHCGALFCPDCRQERLDVDHDQSIVKDVHSLATCRHGVPWTAGLHGCPQCRTAVRRPVRLPARGKWREALGWFR